MSTNDNHESMRNPARLLFAAGCFVPAVGVVALDVCGLRLMHAGTGSSRFTIAGAEVLWREVVRNPLPAMSLVGMIIVAQFCMALVVQFHAPGRRDLTSSERLGWTIAALFAGSIALPLFWWKRRPARAMPLPMVLARRV